MLEIHNLGKSYRGGVHALQDVSLSCGAGVLGLLGPNGAGKTTLMSILATVTRPSSGSFSLQTSDGRNIDGIKEPQAVRELLGFLPQDFGVYPRLTAREFLLYLGRLKGLPERQLKQRVEGVLELVNLHTAADRLVGGFSGGMRQRVGIAQALLGDPQMLIVDEPTVGLDPEERVRFRNLLSEVAVGRLVILSTHIVSDIEATATQIAVMKSGRLLALGTPEDLLLRAAGRVFKTVLSSDALADAQRQVAVSGMVRRSDGVHLRYVGSQSSLPGAEPVEPTLEDAYLSVIQDAPNGEVR
jgi:ABC-2 type transport system ATP-binding protein